MKIVFWLTLYVAILSGNVMATECSSQDRLSRYSDLISSLSKMDKDLPALTPKEVDYYASIKSKYLENPSKYSRILGSNEYLIWDNSTHINRLINLTENAKGYVKSDDSYNELLMVINLLMKVITDHSEYATSYRDSKILLARKLVSNKYSEEAKMISFKVASLGLCVEQPLTNLETPDWK